MARTSPKSQGMTVGNRNSVNPITRHCVVLFPCGRQNFWKLVEWNCLFIQEVGFVLNALRLDGNLVIPRILGNSALLHELLLSK